jgi:hypothetical protein
MVAAERTATTIAAIAVSEALGVLRRSRKFHIDVVPLKAWFFCGLEALLEIQHSKPYANGSISLFVFRVDVRRQASVVHEGDGITTLLTRVGAHSLVS